MELKQIQSFQIDHTLLDPGVYISRIDGDVVTYDIRMKKPNSGDVLENGALHTIEHLFATYVRSGPLSGGIVYFGPMGCRTGFYLLTRGLSHAQVIALCRETFAAVAAFEGAIPGASEKECGNWRDHDLSGAKAEAAAFLPVLADVTEASLIYRR